MKPSPFSQFQTLTGKEKFGIIFLLLFASFYVIKESFGNGDFTLFLKASELMRQGHNPYGDWIQVKGENYARYFYSPLWAVLLFPFTHLPFIVGRTTWLILNVWFIYRIWTLLKDYLPLQSLSKAQRNWVLVLTTALSIRFVLYNFDMIQMTLFLLWGMLESVRLIRANKALSGGILLAFVMNIKLLPLVMLPYLFYRKEWKAAVYTILGFGLFLLIPAIAIGWETNLNMLHEWWGVINPENTEHKFESEIGPHSLTALIPTLLMETTGRLDISRNILSLSTETVLLIVRMSQTFLILLTFYFIKWPPFVSAKSRVQALYELSYIALIIPLIFPHQQKYAFAMALPAMFFLSYYLVANSTTKSNRWKTVVTLVAISFLFMTITTDGIIGKQLNLISRHFKLVTYGMFFLIAALMVARPPSFDTTTSNIR